MHSTSLRRTKEYVMKKSKPVIAIFDIGKTNKKILLYDEDYKIVFEQSIQFEEIMDDDGDPCDDVVRLRNWVQDFIYVITASEEFDLRAVNFSAYGASFVHLDQKGNIVTPLYNYLKPYPQELAQEFYTKLNGELNFSLQTASPVLGSLNSGLQLYRLKKQRPDLFNRIKYSLHLPQYLSWLFTNKPLTDITSIGCHTGLWDFKKQGYHEWVYNEQIIEKLPPTFSSEQSISININHKELAVGVGLHDSSAALIPYISNFKEPFILISTGTWCISLNPFNDTPVSKQELTFDCLFYINYKGSPVKASRLFAGHEHEQFIQLLAEHFGVLPEHYKKIRYDSAFIKKLKLPSVLNGHESESLNYSSGSQFSKLDLSTFKTYSEAYHQLVSNLVLKQINSTNLVLTANQTIKSIFVDGGFSNNEIYMTLLAKAYPDIEVYAASVAQASALGAALAIHSQWNFKPIPSNMVELKRYGLTQQYR